MSSHERRPAPVELLAAFDHAMRSRGWRWYVFGAQAVVAYGRPRMTADVDVTVDLAADGIEDLLSVLGTHRFEPRFELTPSFLRDAHLLPLVHVPTSMPADVVVLQPGLQEDFLTRSRPVDVGGVSVPMVSAEDLIAMKLLAARRKDLEDVRGVLLERWDSLDFELLGSVIRALDSAGATGNLEARLTRIVRQVRRLLGR